MTAREGVGALCALDEQFFAEHPAATFFYRPALAEELAPFDLPPDDSWWQRVSIDPRGFIDHQMYQRNTNRKRDQK